MMKWSTAKPFVLLGGIAAAIAVGMISFLIETRPETVKRRDDSASSGSDSTNRIVTVTPLPAPPKFSGGKAPDPGKSIAAAQKPVQWDEKIQGLLADQSVSVREASRQFLSMAADATGPEAQRVDSVRHGLTLLDNADYLEFALPLVTQVNLPKEMQEVLMADLFNRPPTVSIPAADAIGTVPNHPLAEEARELADFFKSAAAADGN